MAKVGYQQELKTKLLEAAEEYRAKVDQGIPINIYHFLDDMVAVIEGKEPEKVEDAVPAE